MSIDNRNNDEERGDADNASNSEEADSRNIVDFRKKQATDFVFNRRVYLLPPLEQDIKLQLQLLKLNLNKATKEYANRVTEANNLTEKEREGIVSLKERVKNGEIVIQQTDKSGRNVVDSPANYRISVQPHISDDEPITTEEHDELEKEINAHAYTWSKILQIEKDTNAQYRIQNSLKTKNSEYAVLSSLRKDHKPGFDTDEGPPGRTLC